MDATAVRIANERLWKAHPELGRRQLTNADGQPLRDEWWRYYREAVAASAPPPAVVPVPAVLPPPPAPVVASCPPASTPINTSDCKEIKNHVREGDIVLRGERGNEESDFIAKVSKCNFSHAGMVARNDKGELVVVDAYPGRGPNANDKNAVAANSVDDFFCGHNATQGRVTRPKDCDMAKKAAQWALEQTKDPDYVFDLFDPWNNDPKRLYCADFVYQSYQNAGVDLVPDKMDFLSPANKANTLAAAREFKPSARLLSDDKLTQELLKMNGGSSEYITPCQAGNNSQTDTVVDFGTALSGSSGGKKSDKKS